MLIAEGRTTIERLAKATSLSTEQIRSVVDALAELIDKRGTVKVPGLGTFDARTQQPRKLSSPMTDQPIEVPERRYVTFSADRPFKRRLNAE